jgi:hypothetical protein
MINARKIDGTFNIFDGIFTNKMFIFVVIAIAGLQIILIELVQSVMECSPGGLPW